MHHRTLLWSWWWWWWRLCRVLRINEENNNHANVNENRLQWTKNSCTRFTKWRHFSDIHLMWCERATLRISNIWLWQKHKKKFQSQTKHLKKNNIARASSLKLSEQSNTRVWAQKASSHIKQQPNMKNTKRQQRHTVCVWVCVHVNVWNKKMLNKTDWKHPRAQHRLRHHHCVQQQLQTRASTQPSSMKKNFLLG